MEYDSKLISAALEATISTADVTNATRKTAEECISSGNFEALRGNEEMIRLYRPVFLPIYHDFSQGGYIPNIFAAYGGDGDGD